MIPEPLTRLLTELGRLPGVGIRSAERLAFHLLKADRSEALALADAIRTVKEHLQPCARCGLVTETELCAICDDEARDHGQVMVVEQPKDVFAIEKLGTFKGAYHVLMGSVALLEGVDERHLNLGGLVARARAGELREVILALNPNLEGETTGLHVVEALKPFGTRVSQLARGLAAGTLLSDASRAVLEDALEDRRGV
ncbi:MAG: recombination mediator RecR [Planctomycetota bacterium]